MESIQILSAPFTEFACERKLWSVKSLFAFAVIETAYQTRVLFSATQIMSSGDVVFFGKAWGPYVLSLTCEAELYSRPGVNDPTVLSSTGVREDAFYPSPEAPVARRLLTAAAPLPVARRATRHEPRLQPRLSPALLSGNGDGGKKQTPQLAADGACCFNCGSSENIFFPLW